MYRRTLDQTRDLMNKLHNMQKITKESFPYFAYNMFDHETHDELTISKRYDRYLKETIEMFENKGYFNNTMFILMSDHGSRMSCKSFYVAR